MSAFVVFVYDLFYAADSVTAVLPNGEAGGSEHGSVLQPASLPPL